ncbi:MAG: hypothetical protein VSS75_025410 [Candidatus Parabeggiatoa sp.]|nr:hypothetical protein [Candidatus Parabeggiatoa sp.]
MKKTLLSCGVLVLMLANGSAQAMDMAAVKHAHPLPNFMLVMANHGEMLDLSEDQQATLKAWGKVHKPISKQLVKAITQGEKELHQVALEGASKADMMAKLDGLLEKRKELAELKTNCRDKMREVLSDEQWEQVIEYYKDMQK